MAENKRKTKKFALTKDEFSLVKRYYNARLIAHDTERALEKLLEALVVNDVFPRLNIDKMETAEFKIDMENGMIEIFEGKPMVVGEGNGTSKK